MIEHRHRKKSAVKIIEAIHDARRLLEESSMDTPSKPPMLVAAAFAAAMGLLLIGTVNAGPDRRDQTDITRTP
ncbi:hypothetical protein OB03_11155 [Brevundimonas sp. GN22]